jgi:hypothetical protein
VPVEATVRRCPAPSNLDSPPLWRGTVGPRSPLVTEITAAALYPEPYFFGSLSNRGTFAEPSLTGGIRMKLYPLPHRGKSI